MKFDIDLAFLDALASEAPTPGGGSAAAYAGALAAALVAMVARTTLGKKKYADVEARMAQIVNEADACRAQLEQCVIRDAEAFESVLALRRVPTDEVQQSMIEEALFTAIEVPFSTATIALRVLELAVAVAAIGNIHALSDAASGAALANSAIFASGFNVKTNAKDLAHRETGFHFTAQIAEIESRSRKLMTELNMIMQERDGIG